MDLIIYILLCLCCVINLIYCEDESTFFAFIINTQEDPKCQRTSHIYIVKTGQKIEVPIIAVHHINEATIERKGHASKGNKPNPASEFRFHRIGSKLMIMKHDAIYESFQSNWLIDVYMLADVEPPTPPVVLRNGHNYTKITCSMNMNVTDADNFTCDGKCINIWISLSTFMCAVIVMEACSILYYRNKVQENLKHAPLSTAVDKKNGNSDNARYCENPGQKPILPNDRDSSRESGIYEALETLQISRRLPLPEPPQLETLPRPPKPIPMTILREPLPDPPPILSTPHRPPVDNVPTSLRRNDNRSPAPIVIEDENTYEPPPNYCGAQSKTRKPPQEMKRQRSISTFFKVRKTSLMKKPKVEEKLPEIERTSFERIKERPPMPIPAESQETQEDYEEMASSSIASLLPNAESKMPSSPSASLVRNAVPNKPLTAKKPILPKQPEDLNKSNLTRFIKPKPETSQKPTKNLNTSDNITDELSSILKKRKDSFSGASKANTTLNLEKSHPENVLASLKKTSSALGKPNTALKTPATGYLGKVESPTTDESTASLRRDTRQIPELSGPARTQILEHAPPSIQAKPAVSIHVEEINNDDHTQSSDDEWTYEPLPNYNIYSI